MIFMSVLVIATAAVVVLRRSANVRTWLRVGAGVAFAVAALAHFLRPEPFEQHLPDSLPAVTFLVYASGLVELLLGVALIVGYSRRRIGQATALFLVAVWPANVYVAIASIEVDGQPGGIYPWLRVPLQLVFMWWVLWSTAETPGPGAAVSLKELRPKPRSTDWSGVR